MLRELLLTCTLLVLPTISVRCYVCTDGTITINNQKQPIWGQLPCDSNSTYACEDTAKYCSRAELSFTNGSSVTGSVLVKQCVRTDNTKEACQVAEAEIKSKMVQNGTISPASLEFKCSAQTCAGKDYCNGAQLVGTWSLIWVLGAVLLSVV